VLDWKLQYTLSASLPARFTRRQYRFWVGSTADIEFSQKKKFCINKDSKSRPSNPQSNHCTDYVILSRGAAAQRGL